MKSATKKIKGGYMKPTKKSIVSTNSLVRVLSSIQRHDVSIEPHCRDSVDIDRNDNDGEYVKYDDLVDLIEKLKSEIYTCKNCIWRNEKRHCGNDSVISENYNQGKGSADERLIYSYSEGGSFEVGDNFGCVHFEK
jgi:hypothetical protein